MLERQWNSTAGLWTWVWSPGPEGPTPRIIPVHFSDLLFPPITPSLLLWDSYLLRCLNRICIVSWFGFGNCLIRSFTAETRCRGSCSEKKATNGESAWNWKRWQGFGTWYLVIHSDTWWSHLKFLDWSDSLKKRVSSKIKRNCSSLICMNRGFSTSGGEIECNYITY